MALRPVPLSTLNFPVNILSAHKYHTPRNGPLTTAQAEVRRIAYAIKDAQCSAADLDTAGTAMAGLIETPCWLIPIPNSRGDTEANTKLAHAIANHAPGAQIAKAITRTQPVPSQCERHKNALGPIPPEQHHIARTRKTLTLRQTYFVDNVTTSGNTMQAARDALGFGAGLVFADAANHKTQFQANLL